ncbi:hypothetical protein Slin15195_G023640 [Septoria linicola]|uniref:F-box domain-containing protein n=1 Tax=Septoria linicola TaxID=215465 RepID=A0A9Q9AMA1_9PEZI|nr:hypothetical protein Slin14017_G022720 [Septoria linicola]USW49045.1 hypothetical protein Slin15195_G023640 [Septoria linicola]
MGAIISFLMRKVHLVPVPLLTGPMPSPPRPQPCHLLRLPGELRTRIYELALVAETAIEITKDLNQPALLSTCKTIRGEATKMWWHENHFKITITDCDADLLAKFRALAKAHDLPEQPALHYIHPSFRGRGDWANLMRWCRTIHEGRLNAVSPETRFKDEKVVVAATTMAQTHRGLEWKHCEQALLAFRAVAGGMKAMWLRSSDSQTM